MSQVLVGKRAPIFSGSAIVKGEMQNDFSLTDFLVQYVIFFFYPLNFTFVCPTELHAFQSSIEEFHSRDAVVIGCSVDSCFSHSAWLATPKCKGGIEGVSYPLVSDLNKTISKAYQVLKEDEGVSFRGLFLIDKNGVIRHQLINDLPIGRSVHEVLRTLDAVISHDQYGEVCPANWEAGQKTLKPTAQGVREYFN